MFYFDGFQCFTMVNICAAYNCENGRRRENQTRSDVTFHTFPIENKGLLKLWLRNISRKRNFVPTKHTRLCSLHFLEMDFRTDSVDTNDRRKKKRTSTALKRKRLKDGAYPTVFPDVPRHMMKKKSPGKRKNKTSTSAVSRRTSVQLRFEAETEKMETAELDAADVLADLEDLDERIRQSEQTFFPNGFFVQK